MFLGEVLGMIGYPEHHPGDALRLIAQIDGIQGRMEGIGHFGPERLTALPRRVATIESGGPPRALRAVNFRPPGGKPGTWRIFSIHTFTTRDEQEVAGYAETMEQVFQS